MNDHYWLIGVNAEGHYFASEMVPYITLVKESETNLRFVTKVMPVIGGVDVIFDTPDDAAVWLKHSRIPYCFTKKAYERFMS